tara:strand:+ start:85 stop:300 length:216 start_codon:yes stop_codon:yes gene_type:complete
MEILILLLVFLGFYFFYIHQKYLWVGLAILADLGMLGFFMSGAWPLIFLTAIPVIILNYGAFSTIDDLNKN